MRTRPLRPFSFRVAAFGGARDPFGFLPVAKAAGDGDEGPPASTADSSEINARCSAGKSVLRQERWPYRLVDGAEGRRTGGAGVVVFGKPVGSVAEVKMAGESAEKGRIETKDISGSKNGGGAGGAYRHGEAGGGWRHPISTALAISAATDEARLAEKERERYLLLIVFLFTYHLAKQSRGVHLIHHCLAVNPGMPPLALAVMVLRRST